MPAEEHPQSPAPDEDPLDRLWAGPEGRALPSERGPAPVTADDLRAALHSRLPADVAEQMADDLSMDLDRPGVVWVGDLLLWVALLSPAHQDRIRAYLSLSEPEMQRELDRVRSTS